MIDIYIGSGIIAIILLIFQMIVLAVAIDIGSGATDRSGSFQAAITIVDAGHSANASGTITQIEIWAFTNLANCKVATFFVVSGDNLSTRDTHTIGSVTAGSKQTFSGLNLTVEAGDYIGIYYTSGAIEYGSNGDSGKWHVDGDKIPCTNQLFTRYFTSTISLHGLGTTAEEEVNAIFFGTNF